MTITEVSILLETYRLRRTNWYEAFKHSPSAIIWMAERDKAVSTRRAWLASLPKTATRQPLPEGWERAEKKHDVYLWSNVQYSHRDNTLVYLSVDIIDGQETLVLIRCESIEDQTPDFIHDFAAVLTIAAQDAAIIEAELREAVKEWKASKQS